MKAILHITLIFISAFALSCSGQKNPSVTLIDQAQYLQIKQETDVQLIDVRTPEEFSGGNIPDARNINFFDSDFMSQCESLDKSKPVVIYCQSGGRSAKAADKLQKAGFSSVYDLGGYKDWKE